MKLLFGVALGYVLGAKAGRERYESIVRVARRVAGSQTVQSTAGVLQSQVDSMTHRARQRVSSTLHVTGANGHTNGAYRS
ncbi:MAG: hypothetical protein ABI301_03475 [Jatrophihabitantaceae bacterium]